MSLISLTKLKCYYLCVLNRHFVFILGPCSLYSNMHLVFKKLHHI